MLQRLENQPFDEAFEIDDGEDVASNIGHTPTPKRGGWIHDSSPTCLSADAERREDKHSNRGNTPPQHAMDSDDSDGFDDHVSDD